MVKQCVDISIPKKLANRTTPTWAKKAVLNVLNVSLPLQSCEVSLAFCDDATIQNLNKKYRGADKVTDVLAFSSRHWGSWQGAGQERQRYDYTEPSYLEFPEHMPHLGEVVISYDQAQRQAYESGHTVEAETTLLIVHGMLHLLGYDHELPQDKSIMWSLQKTILIQLKHESVCPDP